MDERAAQRALEGPSDDELAAALRGAWHRYVDRVAPVRPALHAYCRRLTGDLWDAEDLVQDSLLRGFGQWGVTESGIRDVRAYLLRTATHVWIDRMRRLETEARAPLLDPDETPGPGAQTERRREVREAAARLVDVLAPQERAALVLKEAFEMPLEEIAAVLATTVGAVKSALHRARGRLRRPARRRTGRPLASAELVDRFVALFDARDLPGLAGLLLEDASAENVGNSVHVGRDPERGVPRFLHAVLGGHPEWPEAFQREGRRLERAVLDGEPVVLGFATRSGREAVEAVFRFEEREGRIARIRCYAFCPETMRAVGEALGVRVRTGLYRAPTPAPGARWPEPAAASLPLLAEESP